MHPPDGADDVVAAFVEVTSVVVGALVVVVVGVAALEVLLCTGAALLELGCGLEPPPLQEKTAGPGTV